MKEGTIVDATIIAAPCSARNASKERDPEPERSGDSRPCSFSNNSRQMHQAKKGNQWHFGMKAHIGVDAKSGLVHRVSGTAASAADVAQSHELLHGQERKGYGEAGYTGVGKRPEIVPEHAGVEWYVAAKRGKVKTLAGGLVKELALEFEKAKARVRARVEHPLPAPSGAARPPASLPIPFLLLGPSGKGSALWLSRSARFHIIKNLFKHRKVRYRGLAKNTAQLYSLFALASLVIARRALLSAVKV